MLPIAHCACGVSVPAKERIITLTLVNIPFILSMKSPELQQTERSLGCCELQQAKGGTQTLSKESRREANSWSQWEWGMHMWLEW